MKRQKLLQHLRDHGCESLREGGEHEIWWNPTTKVKQAIPRHREIKTPLARKVCKALSVPLPTER